MLSYDKQELRKQCIISALAGCSKKHDARTMITDDPRAIAQRAVEIADEVIKLLYKDEVKESTVPYPS
jgi:hypothetical protein